MMHRKDNSTVRTGEPLNSAEFTHLKLFPNRPRIFQITPFSPRSKQLLADL